MSLILLIFVSGCGQKNDSSSSELKECLLSIDGHNGQLGVLCDSVGDCKDYILKVAPDFDFNKGSFSCEKISYSPIEVYSPGDIKMSEASCSSSKDCLVKGYFYVKDDIDLEQVSYSQKYLSCVEGLCNKIKTPEGFESVHVLSISRCTFMHSFYCKNFEVTDSKIKMDFENGIGKGIVLTNMKVLDKKTDNLLCEKNISLMINKSQLVPLEMDCDLSFLKDNLDLEFDFTYERLDLAPGFEKSLNGGLKATKG